MSKKPHTVIESIGVYLPPETITTDEVLAGCEQTIRFPLEKITGIKSRQIAGKEEFAIDLSRKAMINCLEKSRYKATDIDLLICCNISRVDAQDTLSFEPSTSAKLRHQLGFGQAMAFDVTNACAGMFTGIYLANAFIEAGAIRRAMIVSGEYITHLTDTAQREIESFMDSRIACLTLGDAGAALILDRSTDPNVGFQELELQTYGNYSGYCIAKEAETGGWIMFTDSVPMTDVALKSGAQHSLAALKRANWEVDSFEHLLMHQTSKTSLSSARREINRRLNEQVFDEQNTINNLGLRGNTASTSHTVALADQIVAGRINSGDRLVFSVTASGLTIGTALYVFDDLPDRYRHLPESPSEADTNSWTPATDLPRVRVESIGIAANQQLGSLERLTQASKSCLKASAYESQDIGLLIFSGVYRDEYLMEPAYAALLAGELDMNGLLTETNERQTLAFDMFNGAVGFLNACHVAQQMMVAGKSKLAMITTSESENNALFYAEELMGIEETASALILDTDSEKGFSHFLFSHHTDNQDVYEVDCSSETVKLRLQIRKSPELEHAFLAGILPTVSELLEQAKLTLEDIDWVLPPQISSDFIGRLGEQLQVSPEKLIDVCQSNDLFTSALPYSMQAAQAQAQSGDIGLVITVGSGIQVGCAIYHF